MKIEFFDLPLLHKQKVKLPLPMRFLSFRAMRRHVRIYYTLRPDSAPEVAAFYMTDTGQDLGADFPGKYLATIQNEHTQPDRPGEDSALHLFIEGPNHGEQPPLVVHRNKKDD